MNSASWSEKLPDLLTQYGVNIILALAIFVFGQWVAKGIIRIVRRVMADKGVDQTVGSFVANLSHAILLAFVVIAALGQLGIQTASLVAILGAAGLAVGLALQGSLSNLAAGVLMIIFKPFKAGDYIEGGGTAGVVEDIQVFTTQLVTPDNKTVIVPNSQMMGGNIVNYSSKGTRRVDMVFSIGYDDDIDQARSVIKSIIDQDGRVLEDPKYKILLSELADSSVNFAVRVWTKTDDYWGFYFDTTEAVKKAFDAENISIPFPQRDIHVIERKTG